MLDLGADLKARQGARFAGKLLAQAINCIHTGDSVSRLFDASQGDKLLA